MSDTSGSTTGTAQGAGAGNGQPADGSQGDAGSTTGAQGAADGGQAQGAGTDSTTTTDAGGSTDTRTPEELAAAVSEREAENARYRARIRELEAAEAERQRQGMTEAERLQSTLDEATRRADAAEARLAEREYGDDVAGAASRLGFRDPADAAAFVPRALVTAEDGSIDKTKLTAELRKVLQAKPYLGNGGNGGDGGAGRERQPSGSSFNDEIRSRARR